MAEQKKQKQKGRKIGRGKKHQCLAYRASGRLERNKKRKMRRHLKKFPGDLAGVAQYTVLFGVYHV